MVQAAAMRCTMVRTDGPHACIEQSPSTAELACPGASPAVVAATLIELTTADSAAGAPQLPLSICLFHSLHFALTSFS